MTSGISTKLLGITIARFKYVLISLSLISLFNSVLSQSKEKQEDGEMDSNLSIPNYIDVVLFSSVSKIAYAKIHCGELLKAVKTVNLIGEDNDPNFEAHQGIYLKEVKFTKHLSSEDRTFFSQVIGGYTIPYNYLEDDLDIVDDPFFGYSIVSEVNTGKYNSPLSITIPNRELELSVINDLTKILESLISAHKTFLSISKDKALQNSNEFINMASNYIEYKDIKSAVSTLLKVLTSLISEFQVKLDICTSEKSPLEFNYESSLDKYSRLKQELTDLEEDRRSLMFNLAQHEKIQIEKKSIVDSIDEERRECKVELEGIKMSEQIMNKYNGGIDWSQCYSDSDADCACILQNSGSGSRRMRR